MYCGFSRSVILDDTGVIRKFGKISQPCKDGERSDDHIIIRRHDTSCRPKKRCWPHHNCETFARCPHRKPNLRRFIMADINVGDKAPDFSLPVTLKDKMTLSDVLKDKKVVLAFYIFDFAGDLEGLWTAEWARFRDRAAEIRGLNAEVIGISTDGPFCHQAFAEKVGLDFPLLSDYNKEVIPRYGVQYEDLAGFRGLAKRSIFVIDQDSTVKYKWVTDDPAIMPDLDEVIAAI